MVSCAASFRLTPFREFRHAGKIPHQHLVHPSRYVFSLVLVTGCGTQEPPAVNPGAPTTAAPVPAPAPTQDLKGIEQDLKNIKKDVSDPP